MVSRPAQKPYFISSAESSERSSSNFSRRVSSFWKGKYLVARKAEIEVVVEGTVQGIQLSGIGLNSGEMTLTLDTPGYGGGTTQVFIGILDDGHGPDGTMDGVYAAFVTLATTAFAHKLRVRCSYLQRSKFRMNSLAFI